MTHDTDKADTKGRIYGGESPQDRIQKRHEQFLDAGLALIGTVGYKGTSVRGLCREAKLSDRYFYESFETVEDVLIQVYEREIQRIVVNIFDALGDIQPGMSVAVVAKPAMRAFFKSLKNEAVAKLIWFEVLGVSDRVNQTYLTTVREFGDMFMTVVKTLYPSFKMGRRQEELLGNSIIGAFSQTATAWIISGFAAKVDDLVEVNILILEGLVMRLGLDRSGV